MLDHSQRRLPLHSTHTGDAAHALPQESVRLVRPLWLSDVCHHLQLTRRHFPIVSALFHLPGMA